MAVKRRCADCPEWTRMVCEYSFGKYWADKSRNGEGCNHPVDDLAEAWRKAGWTPEQGVTKRLPLPLPKRPAQSEFKLTSLVERYRKGIKK